jgi:outer membrane protein assembly factor BamB
MQNLSFSILSITLCCLVNAIGAVSEAQAILDLHENRGGLAVYIVKGRGDALVELAKQDNYSLHALVTEKSAVAATRDALRDVGVYGSNCAQYWDGGELPYIENLVSLLVCESNPAVNRDEVLRVLSPEGMALFRDETGWRELRKPLNPDTDEWPQHFYNPGNIPVSNDALVAPPRHLQWRGSPRWGRFHEKMSSFAAMVSAGGRVFYIMDHGSPSSLFFPSRWKIVARDAYNGVVLWSKPIDEWVTRFYAYKAGPATVPRRLVATEDVVYVTLGIKAPLTRLCARTGRILGTYPDTECTDEIVLMPDMLLVVLRPGLDVPTNKDNLSLKARRAFGWRNTQPARLLALDPVTGKRLWDLDSPISPLCVAAGRRNVYICDWKRVRCLDRLTGEEKWATDEVDMPGAYPSGNAPRLATTKGVVLFANSANVNKRKRWDAPPDPLWAFSATDGELLWTADHPASGFHSPEDLFVIGNTVWLGATMDGQGTGEFTGLELKTGTVKSTFKPDNNSYWFHQRCYPQRATQKYILTSRTGIEYVDPVAKHWELNHWVRGACTYGVMPANGLTYAPQHPCACYPESKLSGMNALAAQQRHSLKPEKTLIRLVEGPCYDTPLGDEATAEDWPCLRGGIERRSHVKRPFRGEPELAWTAEVAGDLTSPTVGGDMLFTAASETHTVHARHLADGAPAWRFTTDARVDSSPTYAHGHVLFGSRDGYVYCLRASDGVLRWRFLAARRDKRLPNFEQLESVWPVSGSVLVVGKEVYVTAGRSIFLDGGIVFYRLDLATGRILDKAPLTGSDPDGKEYHRWVRDLSMPPANNDLLSSNGRSIYMSSQVLDKHGRRIMRGPGAVNTADQDSHVFSPTGFLDDTWWHRGYMAYGNGASGGCGWSVSLKQVISGKIVCADGQNVYSFGREPKYRKWTLPLEFELTSTSRTKRAEGKSQKRGMDHPFLVHWKVKVPVLVKAMFVTDNALVIAGPRDLYHEEQVIARGRPEGDKVFALQEEHMEGRHGAVLMVVDKHDGSISSSVELPFLPTWDGMITAHGRIYMTTSDGKLACLAMRK